MKIKSKKWIARENLRIWREAVLKRDNYKCQICRKKDTKLNTHHIIPKVFKKFQFEVNNGITLCFYHHKGRFSPHANPIWFAEWLRINRNELYIIALERLCKIK